MFTGIIKASGKVKNVSAEGNGLYVWINMPAGWKINPAPFRKESNLGKKDAARAGYSAERCGIKAGDSISVDGICSTVKRICGKTFKVEYMPETLKKTTAKFFKKGTYVNLEPSLHANDRLDGHLVQGHVDTIGDILESKKEGNSVILKIGFPKQYRKFIAEKGSIAVSGVSLTVVAVGNNWFTPHLSKRKGAGFTVSLVNYTLRHTNLQNLKKGDKVNIEVDVLARYMETLLK